MGCDIHIFIEQKNVNGEWKPVDIDERLMPTDRCYSLFGFLANVRYEDVIESGFAERGIPDDSCFKLMFDIEPDYHSKTYFYLDELKSAPWEKADLKECYFYVFCAYTLPLLCSNWGIMSVEDKRNVRICMGFDN